MITRLVLRILYCKYWGNGTRFYSQKTPSDAQISPSNEIHTFLLNISKEADIPTNPKSRNRICMNTCIYMEENGMECPGEIQR